MADRYTDVVILCEDLMHLNFVRRYLTSPRYSVTANLRQYVPVRPGAGSQHVIKNYPLEVKALRSRSYLRAGLVAVIDADTSSIEDRLRQLKTSLVERGQHDRESTDRIALLSPKRNVETWIFRLLGNDANEEEDYKKRVSTSDIKQAVAAFANVCPQKPAEISLPSLRHACDELTTFLTRGE